MTYSVYNIKIDNQIQVAPGITAGHVLATDNSGNTYWTSVVGPTGSQGIQGETGATGPQGATGADGASGSGGSGTASFGSLYLNRVTSQTSVAAGWRVIDNAFTGLTYSSDITIGTNKFTYTGTSSKNFFITAVMTPNMTLSGSETLQFGVGVNGANPAIYMQTDNTNMAYNRMSVAFIIGLTQNGYVEIKYNHNAGLNRNAGVYEGSFAIHSI